MAHFRDTQVQFQFYPRYSKWEADMYFGSKVQYCQLFKLILNKVRINTTKHSYQGFYNRVHCPQWRNVIYLSWSTEVIYVIHLRNPFLHNQQASIYKKRLTTFVMLQLLFRKLIDFNLVVYRWVRIKRSYLQNFRISFFIFFK